jgi:DNA-3-methyladenine glycosylase II
LQSAAAPSILPAMIETPPALAPLGLAEGIVWLTARDDELAAIAARAGAPAFPQRAPGFPTLLHIILEQQVSIDAAAAMFRRLRALCDPLVPDTFLSLDEATLRRCGFSRQKSLYARNLAERIACGDCDLAGLALLDDDAALAQLRRLKGIGRWTAQVYLLFALGRPDIWPDGDLALQLAVQRLKQLPERPQAAALAALGERWRPWRSVAACLLWQSYLHALGRLGQRRAPGS